MAIAAFFAFALDLGLSQILIRGFSQGNIDLKSAFIGSGIMRLPVIALAAVFISGWSAYVNPSREHYWALFLVGLIQIFMMAERVLQSWLRAHERQTITNVTAAFGSIFRLFFCLLLVYLLHMLTVRFILISLLITYAGSFVVSLSIAYRMYSKISLAERVHYTNVGETIRALWKPSLLFGLIGFLTVIQNRLDWLMVSGFVSKAELANYSVANKFYEVLLMLIGISLTTVYPWMCRKESSNDFKIKLNIFLSFILFLGITISSISVLCMPDVLRLLWGTKYETAKPMIRLLMVGASFSTVAGVFYYILISKRLERKIVFVTFSATFCQVAFNILLIPKFGGLGASVGMLILISTTTGGLFWIIYKEQVMLFAQLKRIITFVTGMLLFAGIFFVIGLSIPLGIIMLAALGIAGMYFVLIENDERKLLSSWIGQFFPNLKRI